MCTHSIWIGFEEKSFVFCLFVIYWCYNASHIVMLSYWYRLLLKKGYPIDVHWAISTVMFGGQRDVYDFHLVRSSVIVMV